ncbi:MAG: hypothetical protein ACLQVY_21855 [Limisphaerales bacterium]
MEFLKRHYEKIVLCVVLLGLAGAAVWIKMEISHVSESLEAPVTGATTPRQPRGKGAAAPAALAPVDLKADELALAQITNPPPVVLSGLHNLFNPVTWKRSTNGAYLKILKSGPDALTVTNITPLYTIIAYDHPVGIGTPTYDMTYQTQTDLARPGHKTTEFAKQDEKMKSGLYIIRGIKGAPDDPTELELEIPATGQTVSVTTNKPYQQVDGYVADLRYEPEQKTMPKLHVDSTIKLDGELYKVIEISSNAVRVQANRTTKVTEVKWK